MSEVNHLDQLVAGLSAELEVNLPAGQETSLPAVYAAGLSAEPETVLQETDLPPEVKKTFHALPDEKVATESRALTWSNNGGLDFELHYGVSCQTVRRVLKEILEDMSTHKTVHNWERKLVITPFKLLALSLRNYVSTTGYDLNNLLAYSAVDEVLSVGRVNHEYPVIREGSEIDAHLFFTKSSSDAGQDRLREMGEATKMTKTLVAKFGYDPDLPKPAQGRIVYVEENIPYIDRASLLILFTLGIRLQNEDYGFLHGFIERHLNLRCALKLPSHWQQTSAPELTSSQQKNYKRVTLSTHITYLLLNSQDVGATEKELLDRKHLFSFPNDPRDKTSPKHAVFKATSSALLTIVIPEETPIAEEEVQLLKCPQGLWTVLVVNCSLRLPSDQGPSQHLTPIAQYLRGIVFSLRTQRRNAESIYGILRDRLEDCDDDSLFDDVQFTKSTLYHWTIRACDELRESIASSLRFLRRASGAHINPLCEDAHSYEKSGVEYWKQQLEDEIYALEDFQAQVEVLNARVQESRNALHGVTAVLEARVALAQGDRIKALAYLATLYLPLTATSSLYSMSVLPSSATLWSFFVVLVIFLITTISMGFFLTGILATFKPLQAPLVNTTRRLAKFLQTSTFLREYIDLLNPYHKKDVIDPIWYDPDSETAFYHSYPFLLPLVFVMLYWVVRGLPKVLAHKLVQELTFPYDQYVMLQYLGNNILGLMWHPLAFLRDIVRLAFLPVWAGLIVGLVALIIVEDVVWFCFFVAPRYGMRAVRWLS